MTASFLKYKHASELFNKKQNNETVDDFCAQMQYLAKQVNVDEQMLRFAVLNGLKPDIKDHVTRSQPTDWRSLVEAAKIGEMCSPAPSETSTMAMQLSLIQEQLKKMSTQHSASIAGNRSPFPRRVHFDECKDDRYERGMTIGVLGTIPVMKVIVTTDATTVAEIDGHRLIIMATAQCPWTDMAKADRIAPEFLVDQNADSPGRIKTEATHDLGIEILGIEEDLEVEVDHPNEVTKPPNRLQTTQTCVDLWQM